MSTPLTDSINALTAYCNQIDGASDTNLSDAVYTLAQGYGSGGGISIDDIADGSEPSGDITITGTSIAGYAFYRKTAITSVTALNVTVCNEACFTSCTSLAFTDFSASFPVVEDISHYAFRYCSGITGILKLPSTLKYLRTQSFQNIKATAVYFYGTPTSIISSAFAGANTITDIYVPWSEGTFSNEPWGASNATMHYDTVFDSSGNPT